MTASTMARFDARLPRDVRDLLNRAADLEGVTMTDFVIFAVKSAAERSIERSSILRLSMDDSVLFAKSIIGPAPEPTETLKRAFQRHREFPGKKA